MRNAAGEAARIRGQRAERCAWWSLLVRDRVGEVIVLDDLCRGSGRVRPRAASPQGAPVPGSGVPVFGIEGRHGLLPPAARGVAETPLAGGTLFRADLGRASLDSVAVVFQLSLLPGAPHSPFPKMDARCAKAGCKFPARIATCYGTMPTTTTPRRWAGAASRAVCSSRARSSCSFLVPTHHSSGQEQSNLALKGGRRSADGIPVSE